MAYTSTGLALSTTPGDSALRNRLYARLGFSEAYRYVYRRKGTA